MRNELVGPGKGRKRGARAASVTAALLCVGLGLSGCDAGTGSDPQVIAGGVSTGIYYAYAEGIQSQLRNEGIDLSVAETGGSVDNLLRVGRGEALIGFAQADAAADAVAGVGAFDAPQPIAAIARVYDEFVQVIVPAESPAESLSDLVGLRVSVGESNSGVTVIADRLLSGAGVARDSIVNVELGLDASVAALERGEIDAFFWVGGVPTPGIEVLSESRPLRMLPVSPGTVERVNAGHAGVYRLSDFPLGTYGTDASVETMTIPNYLVTNVAAPDALVTDITRTLFEARPETARSVPAAALLDQRQAIFTSPVPLHPGAAEYYVRSRN